MSFGSIVARGQGKGRARADQGPRQETIRARESLAEPFLTTSHSNDHSKGRSKDDGHRLFLLSEWFYNLCQELAF